MLADALSHALGWLHALPPASVGVLMLLAGAATWWSLRDRVEESRG